MKEKIFCSSGRFSYHCCHVKKRKNEKIPDIVGIHAEHLYRISAAIKNWSCTNMIERKSKIYPFPTIELSYIHLCEPFGYYGNHSAVPTSWITWIVVNYPIMITKFRNFRHFHTTKFLFIRYNRATFGPMYKVRPLLGEKCRRLCWKHLSFYYSLSSPLRS